MWVLPVKALSQGKFGIWFPCLDDHLNFLGDGKTPQYHTVDGNIDARIKSSKINISSTLSGAGCFPLQYVQFHAMPCPKIVQKNIKACNIITCRFLEISWVHGDALGGGLDNQI